MRFIGGGGCAIGGSDIEGANVHIGLLWLLFTKIMSEFQCHLPINLSKKKEPIIISIYRPDINEMNALCDMFLQIHHTTLSTALQVPRSTSAPFNLLASPCRDPI